MLKAHLQSSLSFLLAAKYEYAKNEQYDYSAVPRPCHNIVFMLEGGAEILSDGERFSVKAGEIMFIPQGSRYTAKWIAEPKAIFHSLHFCFLNQNDPFAEADARVQLIRLNNFDYLYSLLLKIAEHRFLKGADAFFALSAFYELFGELCPAIKTIENKKCEALRPAVEYIEKNYGTKISIDRLAEACYLSTSRFYHLFKEKLGVSPIEYKNNLAIKRAEQELLCHPEKQISSVAENNGFSSVVYFERAFKKRTGKTPSEYRKQNRLV